MHNRFGSGLLVLSLCCIALGGCVAPTWIESFEDSEGIAPLPTFLTLQDCELAYGAGACGTGSQVYGMASLAAPPDAHNWYMPYSFGTMTGALVHEQYAPPGIYLAQVPYRSFLQPAVIQRYALVNPETRRLYHSTPKPLQGGAHLPPPPQWRWQPRPEPVMRPPAPRPLNPTPTPPTPMPIPPVPLTQPVQLIPQKPSPMPAFVNHPPQQGQRSDRSDRPGAGNDRLRPSDRKPEDKK
jgi:hypothetical protein